MITINEFLVNKGFNPNDIDGTIEMGKVIDLIFEYSKYVREEQIEYSAISAAHHSAQFRGSFHQLNNDLENHKNVCKVEIIKQ